MVTKYTANAVNNYFSSLKKLGYKNYSEVNKLLILIFIEELLYGPMSGLITERDYDDITKAIYCIYGASCMLPYPSYNKSYYRPSRKVLDRYRVTESEDYRVAISDELRTEI